MADLENEVIADAVRDAQKPVELVDGKRYAWLLSGGVHIEDLTDAAPAYKTGNITVKDGLSFAHYFGKHGSEHSDVYADLENGTITAVLDAHGADYTDHQRHRLTLTLVKTKAWQTWVKNNRQVFDQADFADYLEEHYPDVVSPDAAELREIVRKFNATVTTTVKSHQRPESGTISLVFDEAVQALGGRELDIPAELVLSIKPFDDCDDMTITAKLRYKVGQDGDVTWHYVLDRPEQHVEDAVKAVVAKVAEDIGERDGVHIKPRTIMRGAPA